MRKIYLLVLLIVCVAVPSAVYWQATNSRMVEQAPSTSITATSTPAATSSTATTPAKPKPATTVAATTTPVVPTVVADPHAGEVKLRAYTTAYTYYDNTPPGSAIIAFSKGDGFPTVHSVAGGTGTYTDPITLAVGHVIENGVDTPDYAPGTRFYLPNLRKYFIVEDTCGDGNRPQDRPCHKLTPEASATGATVWLDLWIGGSDATEEEATACASKVTEAFLMIQNPIPNYAVVPGAVITNGTCAQQFGDKAVTL